jgi:predicted amidohydrolase
MSTDTLESSVGVACVQLAPRLGELESNRAATADAIERAASLGMRLVVAPELCISGYAFDDTAEALECAEPTDGPTLAGWCEVAAGREIVIVGGFSERGTDGAVHNSAAIVDEHGVRLVYRKTHLWDREQAIFTAGSEPPSVVETAVGRVGLAICYDAFFPEVMRALALAGADVIAVPMNSPIIGPPLEPLPIEIVLASAAAHVNGVFLAQADRAGVERGIEWAQASVIAGPDGALLTEELTGPGVLVARCDLAAARDKSLGERNDVLADRRPELYEGLVSPNPNVKETVL